MTRQETVNHHLYKWQKLLYAANQRGFLSAHAAQKRVLAQKLGDASISRLSLLNGAEMDEAELAELGEPPTNAEIRAALLDVLADTIDGYFQDLGSYGYNSQPYRIIAETKALLTDALANNDSQPPTD